MQIQNLHQPFLFYNNNEINLIVSEFSDSKFHFLYGNDYTYENYWKLHHLDFNYNKTRIKTDEIIYSNNNPYYVIQECNPYLKDNILTYVAGIHSGGNNTSMYFVLIQTNLDLLTKETYDTKIIGGMRTGFYENGLITTRNNKTTIYKDKKFLIDSSSYLDSLIRIIGVYNNPNQLIFTGQKNNIYNSFLYDEDNNKVYKIITKNNNENIYKSSIIDLPDNGLIAYTEKVFIGNNEPDYTLNIENGYNLIEQI